MGLRPLSLSWPSQWPTIELFVDDHTYTTLLQTYDASVVADSPDFDQSLKQDVDITCPASGDDGNIISVL